MDFSVLAFVLPLVILLRDILNLVEVSGNISNEILPSFTDLEERLLDRINSLHIGPGGLGGDTTALGVHIRSYATHIAGLPVAVNICCHVNRHGTREI